MATITFFREVIGREVEPSPNKLGPHIISDRTWVPSQVRGVPLATRWLPPS
jgi:hypothetical protein